MYHNDGYMMDSGREHRGYSTEGEESHHAPSVRTVSEYAITHKHSTATKPVAPSRGTSSRPKYENVGERRIHITRNGQGSNLSPRDSPQSIHNPDKVPRHGSPYTGSDLYVTGPAYRASSDLRQLNSQSGIAQQSSAKFESGREGSEQLQRLREIGSLDGQDSHLPTRWRYRGNDVDAQSLLSEYEGNLLSHVAPQSGLDTRHSRFRHSHPILSATGRLDSRHSVSHIWIYDADWEFALLRPRVSKRETSARRESGRSLLDALLARSRRLGTGNPLQGRGKVRGRRGERSLQQILDELFRPSSRSTILKNLFNAVFYPAHWRKQKTIANTHRN